MKYRIEYTTNTGARFYGRKYDTLEKAYAKAVELAKIAEKQMFNSFDCVYSMTRGSDAPVRVIWDYRPVCVKVCGTQMNGIENAFVALVRAEN